MPFLSRLAAAFSPPGSLASSRRARSSASFSAVVCWRELAPELARSPSLLAYLTRLTGFGLHLIQHLGEVGTDLADDRFVDGLDVLATDRDHLEVGHVLAPAAVGLADRIRGSNSMTSSW